MQIRRMAIGMRTFLHAPPIAAVRRPMRLSTRLITTSRIAVATIEDARMTIQFKMGRRSMGSWVTHAHPAPSMHASVGHPTPKYAIPRQRKPSEPVQPPCEELRRRDFYTAYHALRFCDGDGSTHGRRTHPARRATHFPATLGAAQRGHRCPRTAQTRG